MIFSAGVFSAAGELVVFADFAGDAVGVGVPAFRGLGAGVGLFVFPGADFFEAGVGVGGGRSLLILSPRPTPGAALVAVGVAVGEVFGFTFRAGDGDGFGSSFNLRDNKERFAGVADGVGVGVVAAKRTPENTKAIETIQPRVLRFINQKVN